MLIDCHQVTVEFPIYNAAQRSFKKTIFSAASGGRIGNAAGTTIVTALDNISFRLQEGDRLALIGHNGSGKTTLLRTLAGVYTPIRGRIITRGRVTSLIDATLGMDPELTGLENIKIKSLFLGISKKQLTDLIEDVVEFSELGNFINLPVRTYSSGMVLRLAFALSTNTPPEILLMDEWMSVGDDHFRTKAEQRLHQFVERANILVIATHDAQLADRVCNQSLHLQQGKVFG